jgi:hypothetical protein
MSFGKIYNKDNVTERLLILGVLGVLHKKISFGMIRNGQVESFDIPFFYAMGGDERFMYDQFLTPTFDNKELAELNYDKVPRGVIHLTGTTIQDQFKVNPHVFASYIKEDAEGEIKRYFARYQPIPISMTFECVIKVGPTLDLFKISEQIKRLLYKGNLFYVQAERIPIPAILDIPEDITKNKEVEFGYSDAKNISLSFTFGVFSWIPDWDENSEIFAGKRMQAGMTSNITLDQSAVNPSLYQTIISDDDDPTVLNIPNDVFYYPTQ